MMKRTRRRKRAGFTLAEVVVGSSISAIVLSFGISLFLMCIGDWARGENWIQAENDTRQSMRVINDELREAMWVSIDANGQGLTYRKPVKESTGEFKIPVAWDGQDRRIYLEQGNLYLEESAGNRRIICRNVMDKNPFVGSTNTSDVRRSDVLDSGTWQTYRIFTPNLGGVTNEVTVEIVTGMEGANAMEQVRSRRREIVTLRNVPELIK